MTNLFSLLSSIIFFIRSKFLILSFILGRLYYLYGKSFSDRKSLSVTFPLLSLTTLLVISVVKSSLALSLGLVGALSIVRFRTPIKESEDLVYLFIAISIGLGIAASQYLITTFVVFITFLIHNLILQS